jgi:hypothetical protein
VEYLLVVLLCALCDNRYLGEPHQWRRAKEDLVLKAKLKQERTDATEQVENSDPEALYAPDSAIIYFEMIKNVLSNYRSILTSRGYMGLASLPARRGDLCWIIFGTKSPCILRTTGKGSEHLIVGATELLEKEPYHTRNGRIDFWETLRMRVVRIG